MSGTSKALGREIEAHMRWRLIGTQDVTIYATVGEVAKLFEISKQTARKYLNILVDAGVLNRYESVSLGRGTMLYRYREENLEDYHDVIDMRQPYQK